MNRKTFPERFGDILFRRYPEWRQYQVSPDLDWQQADDLAIEVPSRFAPHCPLRIETMSDGVIVSWGYWHVHCDDWNGKFSEEQFTETALDTISELISDGIVIVDYWKSGRVAHASSCSPDELEQSRSSDSTCTSRSWKGTYDAGEFDPAAL